MKVRMLVPRCGPGVNDTPGDVVDVAKDEAERMVLAGQAEPVKAAREKATRKSGETATK